MIACVYGGVIAGSLPCRPCAAQEQEPAPPVGQWRITGVGSCTAAGCHGGGHPNKILGSEYNVWITHDPHAKAYSTLCDERSQRMVELLAGSSSRPATPAHEDSRCLACHSMTDAPARQELRDVVSDGVGCEACHGPAEGWLPVHYERKLSPEERQRLGMWDTDRLLVRTQICVRCHVGSPGREVNHDLIAAGHPRLEFAMTAYFEALPKHWDEATDRARWGADFEALVWVLGQACTSHAALSQLADRASQGPNWPEFAEWSCSACHHDLRNDPQRQEALAERGGLSGRLIAWDVWDYSMMLEHARDVSRAFGADDEAARPVQTSLESLDRRMRHLYPDRGEVAALARDAAGAIEAWASTLEHGTLDRRRVDQLSRAIVVRQIGVGASDWSTAAQTYDALASLHQARLQYAAEAPDSTSAANQKLTQALQKLYDDLAADPGGSDPNQVRSRLIEIGNLLPAGRSEP